MRKLAEKEQRTENILLSLKRLNYLTRSQIQTLHNLKSVRNANRVLKEMDEYISSFRDTENVYYLNSEGRSRVDATKVCKKTPQARHFIMRNYLYIAFGRPTTWKTEMEVSSPENDIKVIADAIFTMGNQLSIIEVDHTQKMSVNKNKIEKYRKLIELGLFEKEPKFIWITVTEYRRKRLLKLCKGLKVQVYTIQDFQ